MNMNDKSARTSAIILLVHE